MLVYPQSFHLSRLPTLKRAINYVELPHCDNLLQACTLCTTIDCRHSLLPGNCLTKTAPIQSLGSGLCVSRGENAAPFGHLARLVLRPGHTGCRGIVHVDDHQERMD